MGHVPFSLQVCGVRSTSIIVKQLLNRPFSSGRITAQAATGCLVTGHAIKASTREGVSPDALAQSCLYRTPRRLVPAADVSKRACSKRSSDIWLSRPGLQRPRVQQSPNHTAAPGSWHCSWGCMSFREPGLEMSHLNPSAEQASALHRGPLRRICQHVAQG